MGIFIRFSRGIGRIRFRNTGQKARTLRPVDQSIPAGFRGTLGHDVGLCIGCKTCAYVCSPGAITLETDPEGSIWWQYQPSRCTFCGRCAEYCPTHAIHLTETEPGAALARLDAAHQGAAPESGVPVARHLVRLQRCARCGKPFVAIPVPFLEQLIERNITSGGSAGFDITTLMGLCEKCRARVTSQRFKDSLTGTAKPNRN